jgi:putative membrane protein
MKLNAIACVLGALCITACSSNTTSPTRQAANNAVAVNTTVNKTMQARSDAEILGTLIVFNKSEIMAAKDAKHKATHPSVRNYAAFLYKEHRNNLEATVSLSQQLKVKPNRNSEVAAMVRQQGARQLNAMNRVRSSAFDKVYIATMIKDHTEALSLIDGFYNLSTNGLIRNQLKLTRAHVAEHLQMAKVIQSEIG